MSTIFTIGCSFLTTRPKNNVDTHVGLELAKMFETQHKGYAAGGRGNTRTSVITKVVVEKFKPDFLVIGWSSPYRIDYVTNDGHKAGRFEGVDSTWRTWHMRDHLRYFGKMLGYDADLTVHTQWLNEIIGTQTYLKTRGINYVMYNALESITTQNTADLTALKAQISWDNYYKPNENHMDFVLENNMVCDPKDYHPSAQGHIEWAKKLKEFIDVNNLRT